MKQNMKPLSSWLMLFSTQTLSALGSGMTNFALVLWLYQKNGSALETALLSVCSYAPYVMMSIFAGALSDRWDKKRTMLLCDLLAALCTVCVLVLLKTDMLLPWHLYLINAVNGLMNTVQQPASEVVSTLLIPKEYYQKTSGIRSFGNSLNTILTPVFASALFAFAGMDVVIAVDLFTFLLAFIVLRGLVKVPPVPKEEKEKEPVFRAAKKGLVWLKEHLLILKLILFLACVNLIASCFNAALPAMLLSRNGGSEYVLGLVNTFAGIATMLGSVLVTLFPSPKNRVRTICLTILLSFGTENFLLALGRTPLVWCAGSILGWIAIPLMNANLDVIFRSTIPPHMQGRVYACRNTLQFFTIPLGYMLGGYLVDQVFEPFMAKGMAFTSLLGSEKGTGAALFLLVLGFAGSLMALFFLWLLRHEKWTDPVAGQ
ncbi:MAG: MFS transporter [Clostridia bacterium]|nr:MFS transporter [Clostridia bacterium]